MNDTKQIVIRVTDEERERLHNLATASNLSLQTWLRAAVGLPAWGGGRAPMSKTQRKNTALNATGEN